MPLGTPDGTPTQGPGIPDQGNFEFDVKEITESIVDEVQKFEILIELGAVKTKAHLKKFRTDHGVIYDHEKGLIDGVLGSGLGLEGKFSIFEKFLGKVSRGTDGGVGKMRYALGLACVLRKFDAWLDGKEAESVRGTWERFLMKMEFELADERVLEVVYLTCLKNKSCVISELCQRFDSCGMQEKCLELMINLGYKDLIKFIKLTFFQPSAQVSDSTRDKIVGFATQKFTQLTQPSQNWEETLTSVEKITPYTNPIFMCLNPYPRTFITIVNNFQHLPKAVADYITPKFNIILKESVFNDPSNVGSYFKHLYLRYGNILPNKKKLFLDKVKGRENSALRYLKLIEIFWQNLKVKDNSMKEVVLIEVVELFREYKNYRLMSFLKDFFSMSQTLAYLIEFFGCFEGQKGFSLKESLGRILEVNEIGAKDFLVFVLFWENSTQKQLQYLHQFMNCI